MLRLNDHVPMLPLIMNMARSGGFTKALAGDRDSDGVNGYDVPLTLDPSLAASDNHCTVRPVRTTCPCDKGTRKSTTWEVDVTIAEEGRAEV